MFGDDFFQLLCVNCALNATTQKKKIKLKLNSLFSGAHLVLRYRHVTIITSRTHFSRIFRTQTLEQKTLDWMFNYSKPPLPLLVNYTLKIRTPIGKLRKVLKWFIILKTDTVLMSKTEFLVCVCELYK